MDWTIANYSYDITVSVVHQTNLDNVLGFLEGVQNSGITITENYESDSRVQAKVSTYVKEGESDGYVDNARLRISITIPSEDWYEELVTGYVSDISETIEHGYINRSYTIEGTIWGLLDHKIKDPITIGKGAKLLTIWTNLMKSQTKMQYTTQGAQDHSFGSTILYEPGSDLSTVLFEISEGYDRMDVDGHGRVTLTKYIAPSKQTPSIVIDAHDLFGLTVAPINKTYKKWESPGRAIVTATISKEQNGKTTQEVIAGSYDAPATDDTSINVRGYLKARSDSYSGASENPSKSELNSIAKQNWEDAQDKGNEWTASSVFADYHAGMVATFIPQGAESSCKVLIKSVTTNLSEFTQELSMKEV